MSRVTYIAANSIIPFRKNPHDKMVSVNEALRLGAVNIPEFMLSDEYDKDKPEVLMVSDREISIDLDTGEIIDGDFEDDFSVYDAGDCIGLTTKKEHRAFIDCIRVTNKRALYLLEFFKSLLESNDEIEVWNEWLGCDSDRVVYSIKKPIKDLTVSDIYQILSCDHKNEIQSAHCLIIRNDE